MSKKTNQDKPIIEACDLALDEWLRLVILPHKYRDVQLYPDFCFPSEEHRTAYLADITKRDRNEVNSLIRVFLMPTGFLGGDVGRIIQFLQRDPDEAIRIEQVKRLLRREPVWEGITWVLDLLHRPRLAINVIHAYLAAHFWWMPDWRISGLCDAMTLIRVFYLQALHPRDELLLVAPRDFELLIAFLFQGREYEVHVTPKSRDGGYDVRLQTTSAGNAELAIVECKRYTNNVGVKDLRALLGVVERVGATRGLLITTAGFTRNARTEASLTNRIELIDYNALCKLFNEHFGPEWLANIDRILTDAQHQFGQSKIDGRIAEQVARDCQH